MYYMSKNSESEGTLRTCFLDRRSFWNFTSVATINKMFMCRWKSLKLMRSGNFKRF